MLRVEFCGVLRERAGTDAVSVDAPTPARVADVLAVLERDYPRLAGHLTRTACAVGDRVVGREDSVDGGEPLVLLPPVSGG